MSAASTPVRVRTARAFGRGFLYGAVGAFLAALILFAMGRAGTALALLVVGGVLISLGATLLKRVAEASRAGRNVVE